MLNFLFESNKFPTNAYLAALILIFFLSLFILNYLKINTAKDLERKTLEKDMENFKMIQSFLPKGEYEKIAEIIKDKIISENLDKYINDKLETIKDINFNRKMLNDIEDIYIHLKSMASAQNNKASLNLVFGVISAISGIAILLIYMLPDKNSTELSLSAFAMLFLPKLSIVIIIETLAFFFLKLYKKSLDDAKVFINQLTEVRMRFAAFNTARSLNDNELIKECIVSILHTQFEIDTEKKIETPYSIDKLIYLVDVLNKK